MAKKNKRFPKDEPMKRSLYESANPSHYIERTPLWSFLRIDAGHRRWSIKACDTIYESIIAKLKDFEGMTWQEIMSASGGRSSGTNSHFENVSNLCKEAQRRLIDMHMEDVDRLFSLRLTSLERLYGVLIDGVFQVLWYDPNHEIYPVSR